MMRITDKINEINKFLDELKSIVPSSLDDYKNSLEKKAACERYIEKIIEAVTDSVFLIIKTRKLRLPEDDLDAFDILLENSIIDKEMASKLKNAKGMRNIIAHEYGKIDDEIVFESLTEELETDVRKFIYTIKRLKLK
ncbi:DUF86 domain-containing protein [Candidatus Woesearchaeota archaeon]|nr:DUF86 domain-containing protein [Candidatus Woesearchaeota archaeon]